MDKPREGHYLDVFSTLKTNEDGSPQGIDDVLPRAQVKKLFAKGELHSSDKAKLAELSKECDWADPIRSGSLLKLTAKELDEYTDHDHL